jgi:hypothetical protein
MHYNAEPATANGRILDVLNGTSLMTSPRPVPIFDGHNDVLLRLYRRGGTDVSRAFLEGEAKGQLDLPMARQGGFVGGLFAIFVPSSDGQNGPNDETASQRVSSGALSAPAVELAPAQRAVLGMVSLLLRIERESKGRVRTPSAFWTHRQDFWKSLTALTGGYAPVRFHTAASLLAPDGHDPADGSHERRRGRGERRPS